MTTRGKAKPKTQQRSQDPALLLHELEVHQLELEMQNEELRRTQLELGESRDRYWALYDRAPFGYLTLERRGIILEANLTAAELLRVDRSGLGGRPLAAFIDASDADRFLLKLRGAVVSGAKQTCDLRLLRPDESTVHVRLDMSADTDARGLRVNAVIVDISDLRRAQDELRESEARFRQIATHIEDVFFVRDIEGRVLYASPAFERIWGRPTRWLVGRPSAWMETIDPEDQPQVAAAWERVCDGVPTREEYRIRRLDGTVRWVQSRSLAVATGGEVRRSVGIVRDITKEREVEAELQQAQKMEAVGTLAGGVAHNLRNVLQAVLASIELVQRTGIDSARSAQTLRRAIATTNRGVTLIDQLMTFARREDGALKLRPLAIDEELRAAEGLLSVLIGDKIRVEIATGAPDGVVMADPVQLEQILLNLATNARDAMPGGGALTLGTRETVLGAATAEAHGVAPGPFVNITVQDDGIGMAAPTKARIFEPFFTTKEVGRGTGLGLSMVFSLVRQFGGYIDVESEPGAGTTFSIFLPSLGGPILATR